jgi:hypothetical protein
MRPTESIVSRARAALAVTACTSALLSAACASVGTSGESAHRTLASRAASPVLQPTASRGSYVISTATELGTRHIADIVRERWPNLVYGDLPRGPMGQAVSIDRFGVYDARGVFLGGPDYLQGVRAIDVVQVRRLTATEEFALLGKRHPAGAVLLTWNLAGR